MATNLHISHGCFPATVAEMSHDKRPWPAKPKNMWPFREYFADLEQESANQGYMSISCVTGIGVNITHTGSFSSIEIYVSQKWDLLPGCPDLEPCLKDALYGKEVHTLVLAWMGAPWSSRISEIRTCPFRAAQWRGVNSSFKRQSHKEKAPKAPIRGRWREGSLQHHSCCRSTMLP